MMKEYTNLIILLFKNKNIYLILLFSLVFALFIPENSFVLNRLEMLPSIIGVVFGGILTSVAIIFGLLNEKDILELRKRNGDKIITAINRLRYHLLLILLCLFGVWLVGFFVPYLEKLPHIPYVPFCYLNYFIFICVTCSLLTFYLAVEVFIA